MLSRTLYCLVGALGVGCIVAGAGWYRAHDALLQLRAQQLQEELRPVAAILAENRSLLGELRNGHSADGDPAVMEDFLNKLRREGIAQSVDSKKRLDHIDENLTTASALLAAYAPHSKTPGFPAAVADFRTFATAWRVRWNSVMETFMAGGYLPDATTPYPGEFGVALQTEIEAP